MVEVSQRKCLGSHREGVWMRLRVQPNARRDEWVGPQGDCIKIRIAAPPVDAAANQRLLSFLSKWLGLSKSTLQITRGHTSREKTVLLKGCRISDLQNLFDRKAEGLGIRFDHQPGFLALDRSSTLFYSMHSHAGLPA